ncbi:MAG: ribosomal protein S18-alanine N-acetyltransferase [Acidobacteria bacterium]|nr:ribosomal protein S18-alanine N-acetyltransferase [Acidobacteriota bacterium]
MAFLQALRNFFVPSATRRIMVVEPAAATEYHVAALTPKHLNEVLYLNFRCFEDGENYTKHTFSYLLSQPNALCFQIATAANEMAGFLCVLVGQEGIAHITTIGVAPEHRRRGLAERMLGELDRSLTERGITSIVLEVRVGNTAAQSLYRACGFMVTQQISEYYNDGEDGYLMVKALSGQMAPGDISRHCEAA